MKFHLANLTAVTAFALVLSGCAGLGETGYFSGADKSSDGAADAMHKDGHGDMAEGMGDDMGDGMDMPFSTPADLAMAAEIWSAMQVDSFVGPDAIITNPYQGNQPHGQLLEIITSHAEIAGHDGVLIAKKNYVGEEITAEDVSNDPDAYLDSVTIMFQRPAGYDTENNDWFWVKYAPDGSVMTNPMGMSLAGRVAKGMDTGCIACHVAAPGGDFVFSHDRLVEAIAQK